VISPISDNVHAVVASAISTGKSTDCSNESEHSVKKVRPEPYSPDYTGVYTFNMAYLGVGTGSSEPDRTGSLI